MILRCEFLQLRVKIAIVAKSRCDSIVLRAVKMAGGDSAITCHEASIATVTTDDFKNDALTIALCRHGFAHCINIRNQILG